MQLTNYSNAFPGPLPTATDLCASASLREKFPPVPHGLRLAGIQPRLSRTGW